MKFLLLASVLLAAVALDACKQRTTVSTAQSLMAPGGDGMQVIQWKEGTDGGANTFQIKACKTEDIATAPTNPDTGDLELSLDKCTGAALSEPLPEGLYRSLLAAKIGFHDLTGEEAQLRRLYWNLETILSGEAADAAGGGIQGPTDVTGETGQQGGAQQGGAQQGPGSVQQVEQVTAETAQAVNTAGYLKKEIMDRIATTPMTAPAKEVVMKLRTKIDALEAMRRQFHEPNFTFNTVLDHLLPRDGKREKFKIAPSANFATWQLALYPFDEIKRTGGLARFKENSEKFKWYVLSAAGTTLPQALDQCKAQKARLPNSDELMAFYLSRLNNDDAEKRKDYGRDDAGQVASYWVQDDLVYGAGNLTVQAKALAPSVGQPVAQILVLADLKPQGGRTFGSICIGQTTGVAAINSGASLLTTVSAAKQQEVAQIQGQISSVKTRRDELAAMLKRAQEFFPTAETVVTQAKAAQDENPSSNGLGEQFAGQTERAKNAVAQLAERIATLKKQLQDIDTSSAELDAQLKKAQGG